MHAGGRMRGLDAHDGAAVEARARQEGFNDSLRLLGQDRLRKAKISVWLD